MDIQKFFDKDIYYPVNYAIKYDNTNFRQIMSEGLNYWLNIPKEKLLAIDQIAEMLYSSLFCIDDVIDNTKRRNGQPTAHTIYGKEFTLSSSILRYTEVFDTVLNLEHPDAIKIFVKGLINAKKGESLEIYFREFNICPTIEITKKIAVIKTSSYLLLNLDLMQLFSRNKTDYKEFINDLGLYTQLVNDYASFLQEDYQKNTGFLNDVTEGKFTLPIVHAIKQEEEFPNPNPNLLLILKQRTEDKSMKQFFLDCIKKHGSLDFVKKEIDDVKDKLRKHLVLLGENPIFEKHFNLNTNCNVNYF